MDIAFISLGIVILSPFVMMPLFQIIIGTINGLLEEWQAKRASK